jgi:nucleotide-binding universal stress UspA family protein
LSQRGLTATSHIEFGKPGDVILRIAENLKVDLIILGTNPHSALRRRFLGATVDKVVDHAHCSVLVIKNGN